MTHVIVLMNKSCQTKFTIDLLSLYIYIFISPILVCIIEPCHGSFYIQPGGLQIFRIHEGGGLLKIKNKFKLFYAMGYGGRRMKMIVQ